MEKDVALLENSIKMIVNKEKNHIILSALSQDVHIRPTRILILIFH